MSKKKSSGIVKRPGLLKTNSPSSNTLSIDEDKDILHNILDNPFTTNPLHVIWHKIQYKDEEKTTDSSNMITFVGKEMEKIISNDDEKEIEAYYGKNWKKKLFPNIEKEQIEKKAFRLEGQFGLNIHYTGGDNDKTDLGDFSEFD